MRDAMGWMMTDDCNDRDKKKEYLSSGVSREDILSTDAPGVIIYALGLQRAPRSRHRLIWRRLS
eukprot:scaffold14646_cov77-Skeletonema_dohrnii-CCMP3373.AAC.7